MTMSTPQSNSNIHVSGVNGPQPDIAHVPETARRLLTLARFLILLSMIILLRPAHAELEFDGRNRFIFEADAKRLSIVISNRGGHPTLAQSSLAWGDGRTDEMPLALNKPMQVILPGQQGAVEVFYEGSGFPGDRESYLLLSVLDLSQAPRDPDTVQLALLHHFKLFFRPKLEQTVQQAIAGLKWNLPTSHAHPIIENASPYFITLSDIELMDQGNTPCGQVVDHLMVAPFSEAPLPDTGCKSPLGAARYHYVTDAGNMRRYQVRLSSGTTAAGVPVE
ncbi:molecular chaperone [Pusillimonas sp. SM2304]|uniref:fimbrial biogenesis chaperone n=1 Tax=Pusillimonas sp. SM2304 TaxID=3073241 RepID=UPI002874021D|nr:molecular chaperone [Pusillimonas sp. SM2304]MDS1138898.1 molecular chaperone [Pusillimonas sp. SM2304]